MKPPCNIAVLVSGGGTNLQALIDRQNDFPDGRLALVLASKPDAYALERARAAGIPAEVVEQKQYRDDRQGFTDAIVRTLRQYEIDIVVLAGFLYILSPSFIQAFPGRVINVHPALIPAFSGKGYYGLRVHQAALDYGVKVTGATVHIVTEDVDAGPILLQKAVDILPGDTAQTLQRRVMEQCEWELLPKGVGIVCRRLRDREAS